MLFKRDPVPFLTGAKGTFYAHGVTGIDYMEYNGSHTAYFCGVSDEGESIGRLVFEKIPKDISKIDSIPIISPGSKGDFDDKLVFDPAAVSVDGKVYLYYSGVGFGEDRIGLAISNDGYQFEKHKGPILVGRAPEIVYKAGVFHLFYVLDNEMGGYNIHHAQSTDGIHFDPLPEPAIRAEEGFWDGLTVVTSRIVFYNGYYYCFYAGGDKTKDEPTGFGVCRSTDLIKWEKSREVLLALGEKGTFDDSAMWIPDVAIIDGVAHMWYEGAYNDENGKCVSCLGYACADVGEIERLFRK